MTDTTSTFSDVDAAAALRPGRRLIDAPTRAFHWLFALSFAGAWLTAESDRWRALHVSLGYAFGGLLLFRLLYGLAGPRPARLGLLWQRVSGGLGAWREALTRRPALGRLLSAGVGLSVLLLLALAAPLLLSGYAGWNDWGGQEHLLGEVHEFCANSALLLVMAHLALIAALSLQRGRNLARPMFTGRSTETGPDLVRANRGWLALLLVAAFAGFVGWRLTQDGDPRGAAASHEQGRSHHRHHHDD